MPHPLDASASRHLPPLQLIFHNSHPDDTVLRLVTSMVKIWWLHREQKLLAPHLLQLAALDQQYMMLSRYQQLLDVMVDTAADVSADHV